VLNADDPRVASMARDTAARVLTYGRAAEAAVRAVDERDDGPAGLQFTLEAAGGRQPATLAFVGLHNLTNALAAAATGVALGFGLHEITSGLTRARPVKGRLVWRQAGRVRILDDTYNANPASVRAALDAALAHRGRSRLLVVLGDMLELGPLTEEAHREVGRQVAATGAAEFVGLGARMGLAVEAARAAGLAEAHHTTTFEDTVAHLLKRVTAGDLLLVKGSRGMRMERVVDALTARLSRVREK
jgi:UDP-N-acetylmuramoyl-tripeptide--D-alanyl-D-alanine ligase